MDDGSFDRVHTDMGRIHRTRFSVRARGRLVKSLKVQVRRLGTKEKVERRRRGRQVNGEWAWSRVGGGDIVEGQRVTRLDSTGDYRRCLVRKGSVVGQT